MNDQTPWMLTRQVQSALGVQQDGVWGQRTDSAYQALPTARKREIDAALTRRGSSRESLMAVTTKVTEGESAVLRTTSAGRPVALRTPAAIGQPAVNEGPSDSWYTLAQLEPFLRAAVSGLQFATYPIMLQKLNLEAAKRRRNGVIEYNARSVNGSYRGLFQMGRDAWSDIQARLGFGYDRAFDPRINARAAALYVENNVRVARARGYTGPITDDVVYTMHNQGVGGFMRLLRGGQIRGNQSAAARAVIARATATSTYG